MKFMLNVCSFQLSLIPRTSFAHILNIEELVIPIFPLTIKGQKPFINPLGIY